jgi:hypothetical protein
VKAPSKWCVESIREAAKRIRRMAKRVPLQKDGNQVHIALHSKDKGQLEAAGAAFDAIVKSFAFK